MHTVSHNRTVRAGKPSTLELQTLNKQWGLTKLVKTTITMALVFERELPALRAVEELDSSDKAKF